MVRLLLYLRSENGITVESFALLVKSVWYIGCE